MDLSRLSTLSLNNTNDIIAHNISLINGNVTSNIIDLFAAKQNFINSNDLDVTQINNLQTILDSKALKSNTYTRTEIASLLALEADQSTSYLKSAVDALLLLKSNVSTTYDKVTTDSLLLLKSNQNTTYVKTEVDFLLTLKQGIIPSNGLSIGQINLLQSSLDSKIASSLVYLKTESDNNYYNKSSTDTLLNLKQGVIGLNGLNINQINLLQSSLDTKQNTIIANGLSIDKINLLQATLDSKIASSLVYTKTLSDSRYYTRPEADTLLLLKVTKTDLQTTLKMNAPTSTQTTGLLIKDSGGLLSSLIIENSKGSYVSQFGGGLGGNIDLRSALMSSKVTIQDQAGLILLGTPTQYTSFNNTIANSTVFTHNTQFNTDVSILTRLIVNSPTTTATVGIQGSSVGEDGTLYLASNKTGSTHTTKFHFGSNANIAIKAGLVAGHLYLQDHTGPCIIGTNTIQTGFQNTIGGNSCFKNDVRCLGSVQIDNNLTVLGLTLSSSDSRIKDDAQPISEDLCIEIVKSVEPKSYIRNDKINNTQREIGFIAQDLLNKLTPDMPNLVQAVQDDNLGSIYAVDYGRLNTILWSVCKNLIKRIELLESK